MERAGEVVARMASRDMSMTVDSKERISELMAEVEEANTSMSERLQEVSSISEAINRDVAIAVQSLQFEDMTRQLIEHMEKRLSALHEYINEIKKVRQEVMVKNGADRKQYVDKKLASMKLEIRSSPVSLNDMPSMTAVDDGHVELF